MGTKLQLEPSKIHHLNENLVSYHYCIYFESNAEKKINGQWNLPGKNKRQETEFAIQNGTMGMKGEKLLFKVGNYKSGDGPHFLAEEL